MLCYWRKHLSLYRRKTAQEIEPPQSGDAAGEPPMSEAHDDDTGHDQAHSHDHVPPAGPSGLQRGDTNTTPPAG